VVSDIDDEDDDVDADDLDAEGEFDEPSTTAAHQVR